MHDSTSPPRPFGATLRDLLLERGVTTRIGNPDWAGFVQQLADIHYETLRKAVVGERQPAPKLVESVSDALSVAPETFIEYRLWQARRAFDPQEVGFEQAVQNLDAQNQEGLAQKTSNLWRMASAADHYLRDLGYLIKERALEAKAKASSDPDDFTRGQLMAFYEVVSLMQSQADAFTIPFDRLSLDGIDPDRDLL